MQELLEKYKISHLETSDGRIYMMHEDVLTDLANEYHKKQLSIYGVVASKRFNKNDLLRAYQAGCLENKDDCVTFGYDDMKELLNDAEKWYKRYTE